MSCRPIVLVHGLWDSPGIFNGLIERLGPRGVPIFSPFLPHELGNVSIYELSKELDLYISTHFKGDEEIDLFGFSMGGLISRLWLQKFDGAKRTNRFISVGSPHKGTYTAQLIPPWLLRGVAEMKRGSSLIKELNDGLNHLTKIECMSFFCAWDLMVFPGWQAVLPVGSSYLIPVLTHKGLINNPSSLDILSRAILNERK
tara:strand:+ start:4230 stop:4829 length:600 start_codon:yes stop_codon:yes gene_type:complete